jgi:hypothetical protein
VIRIREFLKLFQKPGDTLLPIFIAVIILLMEHFGLQQHFYTVAFKQAFFQGMQSNHLAFYAHAYYSASCVALFMILPCIYHIALRYESSCLEPFQVGGSKTYWPIYLGFMIIMLPAIWIASRFPSFYQFYPMYRPQSWSDLIAYEGIYAIQLITIEFFFRGFGLFYFEKIYGENAIFLMTIPYAFIHIHKPFAEALLSIIAGVALGYLALLVRSIIPGAVVHCAVALLTDLFCLQRLWTI